MIITDLIAPISELLGRQASKRPQALAFRDKDRSVSYGELAERTARIASHLQANGVGPGDRVAIHLPNSVDWVEACLGIVRAGAVAVPISFDATVDEIAYRIDDAQCVAAFAREQRRDVLRQASGSIAVMTFENGKGAAVAEDGAGPAPLDPLDIERPAFIVYTSGTTGRAKGVVLSLQSMLWVTAACWAPVAGLNADDYVLNALPLYHSYALNLAVVSIVATGASEYLMENFSTSRLAEVLAQEPITLLPGVPTVFHYMLERAKEDGRRTLSHVRICLSAGAVLPGPLNQEFESWFGVKLLDGYGITETSTMVTINTPGGGRFMGSCGLPLPGLATRIVDHDDRDVAPGGEGELIVRGPNVMLGYHDNPEATAAALRDGWYRTGDLARADRFGFLSITGRLKEIIIRGGQNIAPVEVEEAIFAHESVLDCAVVGIPHEFLGEVPVAFVIPREGHRLDEEAILAHCRTRLSGYKNPQAVHVVAAIPRTGSGKVQRFKLKQLLSEN
ncbi:class I adenylate-forming enzyme family protein [Bosea sp. (in: a-proteobacteria)]|jgi:acyl-CoA synthetase (AMP-forming)/AMP-acid ligase II|uniref:class I adenylate-forming enzyme family protein n=1 Tax=Bosea sp. (in: a-proteobacteria) TaxID=1871050 RepID=UPI002DDD2FB2|nr:AMP-binding protein [Bosea sp. (in: a-proteobacteria)]HEV2510331.1 AMP-binding protein [Bosea sp. (in: a-proteobacteria)]